MSRGLYATAAASLAYYLLFLRKQPASAPSVLAPSGVRQNIAPATATAPLEKMAGRLAWLKSLAMGGLAAAFGLYFLYRRKLTTQRLPAAKCPAPLALAAREAPVPVALAPSVVHVLHSGGFGAEVADMISAALRKRSASATCSVYEMLNFKQWADEHALTARTTPLVAIFVVATLKNEQATEEAGPCVRYFNLRSHQDHLLKGKLTYAVLGLGDSNLLLDLQTTTAEDCNQVAARLDARLCALGGLRCHTCGKTDDRTGNQALEPWIDSLIAKTLYPDAK